MNVWFELVNGFCGKGVGNNFFFFWVFSFRMSIEKFLMDGYKGIIEVSFEEFIVMVVDGLDGFIIVDVDVVRCNVYDRFVFFVCFMDEEEVFVMLGCWEELEVGEVGEERVWDVVEGIICEEEGIYEVEFEGGC